MKYLICALLLTLSTIVTQTSYANDKNDGWVWSNPSAAYTYTFVRSAFKYKVKNVNFKAFADLRVRNLVVRDFFNPTFDQRMARSFSNTFVRFLLVSGWTIDSSVCSLGEVKSEIYSWYDKLNSRVYDLAQIVERCMIHIENQ